MTEPGGHLAFTQGSAGSELDTFQGCTFAKAIHDDGSES